MKLEVVQFITSDGIHVRHGHSRYIARKGPLRIHGLSDEESAALPMQLDGIAIGRMEISTWRTSSGDLDLLVDIPSRDVSRVLYGTLSDGR
jgi:hypothetical protein